MTLNDVAGKIDTRYGTGTTKIWYAKSGPIGRDCRMGYEWLVEKDMLPTLARLESTHTLLGTIDTTDLDEVYDMMQGECWSPRGEARAFISGLGLDHTTMSVGDIVEVGDALFLVDRLGFEKLPGGVS